MIEFELPLVSLPVMLVVLGCTSAHGESTLIAPGAQVTKLADSFKFTEGPAADAKGNVYFTDQPNDRIMKWSVDGKLSTFMQPAGSDLVSSPGSAHTNTGQHQHNLI